MFAIYSILIVLVYGVNGYGGIPLASNTKSFTNAIKDGQITANKEQILFESKPNTAGIVTEQWSGGGSFYSATTIISIYIDNETTPSIQYNLLLGHGMGFSATDETNTIKQSGPFGTKYISHEASSGGLSHRYVIPFTSSIRITATATTSGTFWYWVHGIYNFPVIVTNFNIQLPNTTRLMLYKQENIMLSNLEFITLANVTNTAGLVFGFVLAANSTSMTYLEGCMRIKIDDDTQYQYLSSGTEDIFASSYYFDAGVYHDDQVGLTYKASPGLISAYKFFGSDPMIFTSSMELVWRCGESTGTSNNNGCPNSFPPYKNSYDSKDDNEKNLKAENTLVTTYAWVYEYTSTS